MLSGEVEVDETYIGGKARNMHDADKRRKGIGAAGPIQDRVYSEWSSAAARCPAQVVEDVKRKTLQTEVRDRVEPGSAVYTDSLFRYTGLEKDTTTGRSTTPSPT